MQRDSNQQNNGSPATQLVLERLAEFQAAIEASLEVAGCRPCTPASVMRAHFLCILQENWRLFAVVALLAAAETTSLVYLLVR